MIVTNFVVIAVLVLALAMWAYLLAHFEVKLLARSQQRIGPNRVGWAGIMQGAVDAVKAMGKQGELPFGRSALARFILFGAVLTLPYVFTLVVLYPAVAISASLANVLFLQLIVLLSLSVDNLLQFLLSERGTKIRLRQQTLISLVGATTFLIAAFVPAIHSSNGTLEEISAIQSSFPYFFFLRSPFVAMAAVVALASLFFILPAPPVVDFDAKSFSGARAALYRHVKRVWMIGLASMWVHLFFGGGVYEPWGFFGVVTFTVKTTLIVLLILWAGGSVPVMRPSDALAFALSRLLPVAILALMAELALAILVNG